MSHKGLHDAPLGEQSDGYTPLHRAALHDIIEKGADQRSRGAEGRTAGDIARDSSNGELKKTFKIRHVRSPTGNDKSTATSLARERNARKSEKCHNAYHPISSVADENFRDANGMTPLILAAISGQLDKAKKLLAKGVVASIADGEGKTALHHAIIEGNLDIAELILNNNSTCLEDWDNHGRLALHYVASERPRASMDAILAIQAKMLAGGARVNAADLDGTTPLHRAAYYGREMLAKMLLDKGALVDRIDVAGQTPLQVAIDNSRESVADMLLSFGAGLNNQDREGNTALHSSILNDDEATAMRIIEQQADINLVNKLGRTPLHLAALNDRASIAKLLIEKDADRRLKDLEGKTADDLARISVNEELKRAFGRPKAVDENRCSGGNGKGCNATSKPVGGGSTTTADKLNATTPIERSTTPLPKITLSSGPASTRQPSDNKANAPSNVKLLPEVSDNAAYEPISHQTRRSNITTSESTKPVNIKMLVDHQTSREIDGGGSDDIISLDRGGYTPLIRAVLCEQESEVERLLAKGALVSVADVEGKTALHYSVIVGSLAIIDLILSRNGPVNVADNYGYSALHLAAIESHPETPAIIDRLLARGLNVDGRDRYNRTPLHLASLKYRQAAVEKLLLANASVTSVDDYGQGALHLAVASFTIVEAILNNGADVNARDNFGWTALHLAINVRSEDSTKILVARGADINSVNQRAETPLHIAAGREQAPIARILIDQGADLELRDYQGNTAADIARESYNIELKKAFDTSGADGKGVVNSTAIHVSKGANQTVVVGAKTTSAKSNKERIERDTASLKNNSPRLKRSLLNKSVFICPPDRIATDCERLGNMSTEPINRISTVTSVGEAAMLVDLFARKLTGERYASGSTEMPMLKDGYMSQKVDAIEKSLRLSISKFSNKGEGQM